MSNPTAHGPESKRPYRLGKRAAAREATRQRIVDAAVELHTRIGPARTSVAQIAEQAGVQRHTYYAHFPREWDLFLACSHAALERDPLPDAERWRSLPSGGARIAAGLTEFYGWFARNEQLAGCVLRDAEHHDMTRKITQLRMEPVFAKAATIMGEGLSGRAGALLGVALDLSCWRILGRSFSPEAAAALMRDAIMRLDG